MADGEDLHGLLCNTRVTLLRSQKSRNRQIEPRPVGSRESFMRSYMSRFSHLEPLASRPPQPRISPRAGQDCGKSRSIDDGGNTPPQVMQQCTDAETDKLMNAFGGGIGAEMCSKQEIRKVGRDARDQRHLPGRADDIGVAKRGLRRLQQQLHGQGDVEDRRRSGRGASHGRRHHDHPGPLGRCLQGRSAARRHHDGGRQDHEHPRSEEDDGGGGPAQGAPPKRQ